MANILLQRLIAPDGLMDRWELYMRTAYRDTDGTWHCGHGHGNANNYPPFVDEHTVIETKEESLAILAGELHQFYMPQLDHLLASDGIVLTDPQYNACLDIVYNRGAGTFAKSKAYDWLKHPEDKNYLAHAAESIVNSDVYGFTPLNVAKDRVTGAERVYLGLTCRRIDDAALFQAVA